jgi:hypothetical protein
VVFHDDVVDSETTAHSLISPLGLGRGHIFQYALKGFSAMIPAGLLEAVRRDPRVRYVVRDQEMVAFAQTIPTGIRRIGADLNATAAIDGINTPQVNVAIAIIDTGIDLDHPDLNVKGGVCYACGGGTIPDDANGHGSHVAGIAAALDNDIGVVGVAPGAPLYAVRVLDYRGSGSLSNVAKGVDWVTKNTSSLNIKVANLSLGGSGSDDGNCGKSNNDPLHTAICNSVAAGVTYVVAAGNSAADAKATIPAAYREVITVSALADSDGLEGGIGLGTGYGADDTFATFSNYGPAIDLIAPGVSIYSTYKLGGYSTLSGTSMAAPHVAGAAALYLENNPGALPEDVRQALIDQGQPGPWSGPDAIAEPLVHVGAFHDVAVTAISAPAWVLDSVVPIEVTVTVTVKNTGTFPEMPTLTLTDQTTGTIWGPIDIGTLEPGATTTTPFQWTATPLGVHTIRGQISLAEDSNAANDAKSVQIEVKAPIHDVAVTALTAPASAITGQPVQITATVANLGTFEEQFNVTLTDNDAPVGSWINILLDAGTAAALSSIQWTPATQGDHTLRATASPVPDESPLPNNVIEKSVNVSDVPSLGVTVTTNKPTYAVGNTVTITTGVTNNGGSSVSGASVQVVIKGPNGRTTSKSGTTGASGAFVWSWGTSSFTPLLYGRGTYTVNATASKSGYQSGVGATSFLLP